jgi:hypothetical protein
MWLTIGFRSCIFGLALCTTEPLDFGVQTNVASSSRFAITYQVFVKMVEILIRTNRGSDVSFAMCFAVVALTS